VTPDTTTTREYQVRYPDGSSRPVDSEDRGRRWIANSTIPGAKVYARTVTTTRSAWAEVVEAKEAQHG